MEKRSNITKLYIQAVHNITSRVSN